jgi:hypothetical protein
MIENQLNGHMIVVSDTNEYGIHSGRRRQRVECRTCGVLVHPATTGPDAQIRAHIERGEYWELGER